jgi:hypothetical protein
VGRGRLQCPRLSIHPRTTHHRHTAANDADYTLPKWEGRTRDGVVLSFKIWDTVGGPIAAASVVWLSIRTEDPLERLRAAFVEAAPPATDPARADEAVAEAQRLMEKYEWDERIAFLAMCVKPWPAAHDRIAAALEAYECRATAGYEIEAAKARASALGAKLVREHKVRFREAIAMVNGCERRLNLWRGVTLKRSLMFEMGLDETTSVAALSESRRVVMRKIRGKVPGPSEDSVVPAAGSGEVLDGAGSASGTPSAEPRASLTKTEKIYADFLRGLPAEKRDQYPPVDKLPRAKNVFKAVNGVGVELRPLNRDSVPAPRTGEERTEDEKSHEAMEGVMSSATGKKSADLLMTAVFGQAARCVLLASNPSASFFSVDFSN